MSVLPILLCMLAGICGGWFLLSDGRRSGLHNAAATLQFAGTLLLLFCMGLWLGGNREFWDNLAVIGVRGAAFAFATTGGGIAVTYLLARRFLDQKDPDKPDKKD